MRWQGQRQSGNLEDRRGSRSSQTNAPAVDLVLPRPPHQAIQYLLAPESVEILDSLPEINE